MGIFHYQVSIGLIKTSSLETEARVFQIIGVQYTLQSDKCRESVNRVYDM